MFLRPIFENELRSHVYIITYRKQKTNTRRYKGVFRSILQTLTALCTDTVLLIFCFLWPPYWIGQAIIFSSCGFFLLLPYFHTWCGLIANLGCRSETCCTRLAGNAGRKKIAKKSPSAHHRTILSGYIFATKAHIDNQKKSFLSSNISSRCLRNMVNFGLLAAEIDAVVCGTPANFNGFCVLAALLHGSQVVSVSRTLRRWTEGTTYVRQGDHHGHWPTF